MPRRRMTPARQRQVLQWQRAGARARAEKSGNRTVPRALRGTLASDKFSDKPWVKTRTLADPMGKNVTLYHRTSMKEAKRLATKGFKVKKNVDTKDVYFSTKQFGSNNGFGPAQVKVRIRSKLIGKQNIAHVGMKYARKDEGWKWKVAAPSESWVQVDSKHLKGIKVTRVSTVPKAHRGKRIR